MLVVNPGRHELGRSAYLCRSDDCIKRAVKEKKISRMLKVSQNIVEALALNPSKEVRA